MPDDLREHYLRALLLLRDMFEALALDHLEDAPATVPLRIPVDQLLAWRTRAAALPLDEAANATRSPENPSNTSPPGGEAAGDRRGVGPDGLPLLRLALPMSVELVAAIARGVCEELEPLGYTVHIGDDAQLVARPAERNT